MNLLKQSIQKLNKTPNLSYALRTFSAVSKQEIAQTNEENDKLYKTVELELKGNDPAVLNSFAKFATIAAKHLEVPSKTWNLRKPVHDKYTVLKSVHIYKKHRVQYEIRTYFTFVQYKYLTESTADTLLEYLQRNLPEGVALKTSKVEIQSMPEHLLPSK